MNHLVEHNGIDHNLEVHNMLLLHNHTAAAVIVETSMEAHKVVNMVALKGSMVVDKDSMVVVVNTVVKRMTEVITKVYPAFMSYDPLPSNSVHI